MSDIADLRDEVHELNDRLQQQIDELVQLLARLTGAMHKIHVGDPCPYYAIKEDPGGGFYIVECDLSAGHDDAHHGDEPVAASAWEHPEPQSLRA